MTREGITQPDAQEIQPDGPEKGHSFLEKMLAATRDSLHQYFNPRAYEVRTPQGGIEFPEAGRGLGRDIIAGIAVLAGLTYAFNQNEINPVLADTLQSALSGILEAGQDLASGVVDTYQQGDIKPLFQAVKDVLASGLLEWSQEKVVKTGILAVGTAITAMAGFSLWEAIRITGRNLKEQFGKKKPELAPTE